MLVFLKQYRTILMKSQLSKNSAFTYFSGNATPLQKKLMEEWLREEQNREQFYQWLEEWETESPQVMPNSEKAMNAFLARIENAEAHANSQEDRTLEEVERLPARPWRMRWWIAAALVLLCLATAWQTRDVLLYQTYETAYGEIKAIRLDDGSAVTLNAHSALTVPRFGFGASTRQVSLKGEAEFIVAHTPNHQRFLVHTPTGLEVEVLGTEFVVNTRAKGTKVALHKGAVRLRSLQAKAQKPLLTLMHPGDVVLVDRQGNVNLQSGQVTAAYSAWKEHRFVFDQTSLQEIADQMHENFGWQVRIPDSALASRTIAGAFKADTPDELLQVLSELLGFHVTKQGKQVILSTP